MTMTVARGITLAFIMLMAGCAMDNESSRPTNSAPAPETSQTAGSCDAAKAPFARGAVYTEELAQRARQASGAKTVRALRPGQAVTMEFSAERLNLELDESGRVTDVRCG